MEFDEWAKKYLNDNFTDELDIEATAPLLIEAWNAGVYEI